MEEVEPKLHICSRCKNPFIKKSEYERHLARKYPCKVLQPGMLTTLPDQVPILDSTISNDNVNVKRGRADNLPYVKLDATKIEKNQNKPIITKPTDNDAANLVFDLISQAEQFGNNKIDIIICDKNPWFKGNDIAKILGYKRPKDAICDNVKNKNKLPLKELCSNSIRHKGNQKNTIYINKKGLIQLLSLSKMPNKSDFIRWCKDKFNINYDIITRLYKEQETIGQIIKVFNYKKFKLQYQVDNYRIDLYFYDDKLAIECDEFGHKYRDQEYEKKRETHLRNKLDCKFIRYNPDDSDFCMLKVFQQIIMHMYHK